jgi:hypothetical protein
MLNNQNEKGILSAKFTSISRQVSPDSLLGVSDGFFFVSIE